MHNTKHISGGIFLISLGILMVTQWWWPGIMLAIGLAAGAELAFRGQYWRGAIVFAVCAAIPLSISAVPWAVVAPWLLIVIGVVAVVKAIAVRNTPPVT